MLERENKGRAQRMILSTLTHEQHDAAAAAFERLAARSASSSPASCRTANGNAPCWHRCPRPRPIRSFACKDTESFFKERNTRAFPPDIQSTALRKLAQLHSVTKLQQLAIPPGNRLEVLKGDRKGQHFILINDQRRVCTVDTALRLERYFGWPAEVWLNLQTHHDQQAAKESIKSTRAPRCERHQAAPGGSDQAGRAGHHAGGTGKVDAGTA